MIWFKIKDLEKAISENRITKTDSVNYFIGCFIIMIIVITALNNNLQPGFRFIGGLIAVGISLWGISTLNKFNEKKDGKDFFVRFFAIFFVKGIHFIIIAICIQIFLGLIYIITNVSLDRNDLLIIIIYNAFYALFFNYMLKSFKNIELKKK